MEQAIGLRRLLLAILALGIVGVFVELLLLGHTEERMQLVPLVMLAVGLLSTGAVWSAPSRATVQIFTTVMALFVASGFVGLYQHYSGNVEFELELYPSIGGWELFSRAMTGATPALAPGTMVLLGLVGLASCWRHPMFHAASRNAAVFDRGEE